MSLTLLTPPTIEPVSLADAKLHLRVDDDTIDNTLIVVLLAAARQWAEEYCRRAFVTQTWRLTVDRFPSVAQSLIPSTGLTSAATQSRDALALKRAPVASVTSVQYVDAAGVTQLLAAGAYVADLGALPPTIAPAYGTSWPTTRDQKNAVTVEFVAGYGAAVLVPGPIKAAILLLLGDLYANREAQIVGTIITENRTAMLLLDPYRIVEAV